MSLEELIVVNNVKDIHIFDYFSHHKPAYGVEERYITYENVKLPANGSSILVDMMIETIRNKERQHLSTTFIRNCLTIGLNVETTIQLCNIVDIQVGPDLMLYMKSIAELRGNTIDVDDWDDSILENQYNQPIIFNFDAITTSKLLEQEIDIHLFKLIARHLFVVYKRDHVIIQDYYYGDLFKFTEPIPISHVRSRLLVYDFRINYNNKCYLMTLQNLIKIVKPWLFNATNKRVELTREDDYTTTFVTYPLPTVSKKELCFSDRPKAIDFILHSMLDNTKSRFTQEELNERVNYFESFIAYKFQHPGYKIYNTLVVNVKSDLCTSVYSRILREMNPYVKVYNSLRRQTQRTKNEDEYNIITFYDDVNFDYNTHKADLDLKIIYSNSIPHNPNIHVTVFTGTKTYDDVEKKYYTPGFIFSSIIHNTVDKELEKEYFNYLISLNLDDFNPNVNPCPKAVK